MSRRRHSLSRCFYSLMLLGYPRSFRARYAEQMCSDFGDLLRDHMSLGPFQGRLEAWKRVGRDLAVSIPRERFSRHRRNPGRNRPKTEKWFRRTITGALIADGRYTLRSWRKAPIFVAVAALTIALGIGATTTIFSVANSLLLRTPGGVREPDGLVTVFTLRQNASLGFFSRETFAALRESETGLSQFGTLALFMGSLSTGLDAEPERVAGLAVSSNYFTILRTRTHLGRFFAADEDAVGTAAPVVVLSHRQWVRRFAADSNIVGRIVNINRVPFTVIGVAEEGFQGHVTGYEFGVWIPLATAEAVSSERIFGELIGIGRIAANSSISQVAAAFAVASERLREQQPEEFRTDNMIVNQYGGMIDFARRPVTLFMVLLCGISGIVLMIACVNVAGMLLSRASARSREIAVRIAIGAGRGRVIRQLVTESTMLFLLGGGCGTVIAIWATQMLGTLKPPAPLPFLISFAPDARVLTLTLAVAFLSGVGFGLAPALQVTKPDIVTALKSDRTTGVGLRGRMRNIFVVAQVTGSVVLLILAGVFVRALSQADSINIGFDPTDVHVYTVDVSIHHYSPDEGREFFRELRARASALPGVESAALAWVVPMGFEYVGTAFEIPGREPTNGDGMVRAGLNAVSPDYFETLRIGIVAGRGFTRLDRDGTKRVAIVNSTAAARFWPNENAIGKQLQDGDTLLDVIGIVNDATYRTLGEDPRPMVFLARTQSYAASASLLVRTAPGRSGISREISQIASGLDQDLPAQTNAPYLQVIGSSLLPNRAAAAVASAFGLLGLVLASVGLYGILSYAVSLRLREISIRIALGADKANIRKIVLGTGLKLILIGLGIGLPVALVAATFARSMLLGLNPVDPVTFGGIAALFCVVGLLASYMPARRAMQADPLVVLQCE